MAGYIYKISGDLRIGIDFYGISVSQTGVALSGESSVTADATRIRNIVLSIDITSDLLISGTEFQFERVDIHCFASVNVTGEKIVYASSSSSFSLSSNSSAIKIAKTSSTPSSSLSSSTTGIEIQKASSEIFLESSSSVSGKKIAYATTSIQPSASVSVSAHEILNVSASISGVALTIFVFKKIVSAKTNINVLSPSLLINLIKFKTNGGTDTSNYQTLFVLDNSPLTNQGRTFSSDLSQVFIENKNWNNSKSRYYKRSNSSGRKTFTLSWTYLPNSRRDTVDRRHARDFLKSIAKDADIHTLKMINDDSNDETPYTETEYQVFIKDYSETLLRRDLINGVYYWDCNMTLEEA
jgi:hypothetical protein